jgi:hypothetical protein
MPIASARSSAPPRARFLESVADASPDFVRRLWDFFVGNRAPGFLGRAAMIARLGRARAGRALRGLNFSPELLVSVQALAELPLRWAQTVAQALAQTVLASPILNGPAVLAFACGGVASAALGTDDALCLNGASYRLSAALTPCKSACLL